MKFNKGVLISCKDLLATLAIVLCFPWKKNSDLDASNTRLYDSSYKSKTKTESLGLDPTLHKISIWKPLTLNEAYEETTYTPHFLYMKWKSIFSSRLLNP